MGSRSPMGSHRKRKKTFLWLFCHLQMEYNLKPWKIIIFRQQRGSGLKCLIWEEKTFFLTVIYNVDVKYTLKFKHLEKYDFFLFLRFAKLCIWKSTLLQSTFVSFGRNILSKIIWLSFPRAVTEKENFFSLGCSAVANENITRNSSKS